LNIICTIWQLLIRDHINSDGRAHGTENGENRSTLSDRHIAAIILYADGDTRHGSNAPYTRNGLESITRYIWRRWRNASKYYTGTMVTKFTRVVQSAMIGRRLVVVKRNPAKDGTISNTRCRILHLFGTLRKGTTAK
jgi:hypothetical protein